MKDVNFARFMADKTKANFNVVREVIGSGNKTKSMMRKEKACQFHWSQILD